MSACRQGCLQDQRQAGTSVGLSGGRHDCWPVDRLSGLAFCCLAGQLDCEQSNMPWSRRSSLPASMSAS